MYFLLWTVCPLGSWLTFALTSETITFPTAIIWAQQIIRFTEGFWVWAFQISLISFRSIDNFLLFWADSSFLSIDIEEHFAIGAFVFHASQSLSGDSPSLNREIALHTFAIRTEGFTIDVDWSWLLVDSTILWRGIDGRGIAAMITEIIFFEAKWLLIIA